MLSEQTSPVYVIMIIVNPGDRHPAELASYSFLHDMVKARFDAWWHHFPNVFLVCSELNVDEIYEWLNRVWPVSSGTLGPRSASASSDVLVLDVSVSKSTGRLPSWEWLNKYLPSPNP